MTGQNGTGKDFYAVLGVEPDASQAHIKSEYRWLAKKFHPDTNQGDSRSAKRFQEINEAYGVLSNPTLRAAYDSSRPGPAEGFSSGSPGYSKPAPEEPPPPTETTNSSPRRSSGAAKQPASLSSGAILALTSVGIVVVTVLAFSSLGANSNSATTEAKVSSSAASSPDPEVPTDSSGTLDLSGACSPSGNTVESITFSGDFGQAPTVTFDEPLQVDATERTVIIEGTGGTVKNGDDVLIDYALYNAATGELIEESGYDELSPTLLTLDTKVATFVGVSLTAACSTVGSRVAGLIPSVDAFGLEGAPEFGLGPGEALLFVVDIIEINPRT
jgi:hypothetical protein